MDIVIKKHCPGVVHSKRFLGLPKNYTVHNIPSGCCGMAGSFGYEKEHYDVSRQLESWCYFQRFESSQLM